MAAVKSSRPLFVYGTLMDDDVVQSLLGRVVLARRAVLLDFEHFQSAGLPYPYVLPQPGARVHGRLLLGLSVDDLQRLDDYEDVDEGLYCRVEAHASLADGSVVRVWVYAAPEDG